MAIDFQPSLQDLQQHEFELEEGRRRFLRDRGWNYTSDHPGCVWLWDKVVDGKTYCVDEHVAVGFEEWWENLKESEELFEEDDG